MARTFNGTTDDLTASIGGWNSITGVCSIAILGYHTARTSGPGLSLNGTGNSKVGFTIVSDAATIDTVDYYVNSVDHYVATDQANFTGWVLIAMTKATGTVTPRAHIYNYTAGTWSHANMDTGGTAASPAGSSTSLVFGINDAASNHSPGDIAVAGAWSANLSDQQVESLAVDLDAWFSSDLKALHLFDQAATTTNVIDLSGNGANQTAITGTSVSSRSVPLFKWEGGPLRVQRIFAGTTFTISPTGAITPSGALSKADSKAAAGNVGPTGAAIKAVSKTITGGVTPTGALAKLVSKLLTGGITPTGALSTIKVVLMTLTGSLTPTGTLAKAASKGITGNATPTGTLGKAASMTYAGTVTPSGAASKAAAKAAAGSVTPTGAAIKTVGKGLAGALTPTGALAKAITKLLVGALTPLGSLATSGGTQPTETLDPNPLRIAYREPPHLFYVEPRHLQGRDAWLHHREIP